MSRQQAKSFVGQVTRSVSLDYLLYLPPDYDSQDTWPLILYLHDYDQRGENLEQIKQYGPPQRVASGEDFPAMIASPQCPQGRYWPEQTFDVITLLDHLIATSKVDPERVYLTGLNMGGYGVWALAARYTNRFAAMAPVGGGGEWWMLDRLTTIPVWAFHIDIDDIVPLIEAKVLVRRITEAGGSAQITVFAEFQQDEWAEVYSDPALYAWMLEQKR